MKKIFLNIILVFICNISLSQNTYDFMGALKLNGNDQTLITYQIVFKENNGKIVGYSMTDMNGPHETKNTITGTYDKKTKLLTFKENEILYTKSKFGESSFCFVNYSGEVKLVNSSSKIDGDFKGLFNNKTKCINGTITLVGSDKILKMVTKVNKKIQKSNKLTDLEKEKFNTVKLLDSIKINRIYKNEELNVFWEDETFQLDIWDSGKEDGDIINLYHNDVLLLSNYKVTTKKKSIQVKLKTNKDTFKLVAISEGTIKPNTPQIKLTDKNRTFELMANLEKGDESSITVIKKAPK